MQNAMLILQGNENNKETKKKEKTRIKKKKPIRNRKNTDETWTWEPTNTTWRC